jgi:hypothetical protein
VKLSDASPATLRVVAAALEAKARYHMLGRGTVVKLAMAEPGANVEHAVTLLGLDHWWEIEPEPARTA